MGQEAGDKLGGGSIPPPLDVTGDRAATGPVDDLKSLDGRRVAARLIDGALLVGITWLLVAVFGPMSWRAALIALWSFVVYFFACEATTGQTLGKRLMGLRVLRRDGTPPDAKAVGIRNVLRIFEEPVLALIVMVGSRKRRQRLGDLAAGTTVGRSRGSEAPAPSRWRVVYPAIWAFGALGFSLIVGLMPTPREAAYLQRVEQACLMHNLAISQLPQPTSLLKLASVETKFMREIHPSPTVDPQSSLADLQEGLVLSQYSVETNTRDLAFELRLMARSPRVLQQFWDGRFGEAIDHRAAAFEEAGIDCEPAPPEIVLGDPGGTEAVMSSRTQKGPA